MSRKKKDVQNEDIDTNSTELLSLGDQEAADNANALIASIDQRKSPWTLSKKAEEAKRAAMAMLSTKNGLHARVPLICKSEACPYAEQCVLLPNDLAPLGEPCPVELAQIDVRANGYMQDIDYDSASFTDKILLSEIVQLDILLERCRALMSKEGTPVIEMAIGIDNDGNEIDQPAVSKAWEAYEKISKKRDQTYQLLMMTRKDHKNDDSDEAQSVSSMLEQVINADISV